MSVTSISQATTTQVTQSSQSTSQSELKTLEKQKAQIQTIDARILQINQKQTEAEKTSTQQQAPSEKGLSAPGGAPAGAAAPAKPLTRGNVDIEI